MARSAPLGLCLPKRMAVGCGNWSKYSWGDLGNQIIQQERDRVAGRVAMSDMGMGKKSAFDTRASGVFSQIGRR